MQQLWCEFKLCFIDLLHVLISYALLSSRNHIDNSSKHQNSVKVPNFWIGRAEILTRSCLSRLSTATNLAKSWWTPCQSSGRKWTACFSFISSLTTLTESTPCASGSTWRGLRKSSRFQCLRNCLLAKRPILPNENVHHGRPKATDLLGLASSDNATTRMLRPKEIIWWKFKKKLIWWWTLFKSD